ncbi:MAG: RhuM family protein [Lentisphaeria bacterium]
MNDHGEVRLYEAAGQTAVAVRLERDTVWLTQKQMALLFDKDSDTIGLHLRNVYAEGELAESATAEESSVVQQEGTRSVRRRVKVYNLDAIISVGYRVNSKRGTQFRQWATRVLREHLVRGYTVNEKRLAELKQAIRLVETVLDRQTVAGDEAAALLRVVADFTRALDLMIAESRPAEHPVILALLSHLFVAEPAA